MEAESKRRLSEFLKAKMLSDRLKYSKSLLKNRYKEFVYRGLESLKVEPDDSLRLVTIGVPSLKVVLT